MQVSELGNFFFDKKVTIGNVGDVKDLFSKLLKYFQMINQRNSYIISNFRLTYNYAYIIFSILGILFIAIIGFKINLIFTFIFSLVMIIIPIVYLNSIARIELNELSLKLIYRPFYKPKIFEYSINQIDLVSIYYTYKRYHSTIMFIKLKNSDSTIKHTAAMSVSNSKKLVEVLRNLNVNVIELEWPKVEGKEVTLP